MANVDAPFGLLPIGHLNGDNIVYGRSYTIASGYAKNLSIGDPVLMTGTGRDIAGSGSGSTDPIGVFAGCKFVDAAGDLRIGPYWTAGATATQIEAFVWDDPQIVFAIQCDVLNEADVGLLANTIGSNSLNPYTAVSDAILGASVATPTGKTMRIRGLHSASEYGAFAVAKVTFAQHVLANVVAGVGGT